MLRRVLSLQKKLQATVTYNVTHDSCGTISVQSAAFRSNRFAHASPSTSLTMKDLLKHASTADLQEAIEQFKEARKTTNMPDWGVVKLASIALAKNLSKNEVETLLETQYHDTGGRGRFARLALVKKEQIVGALNRILLSPNCSISDVVSFYQQLVGMKFCANKDEFIATILQGAISKGLPCDQLVALFKKLIAIGRVKSLAHSAYLLRNCAISQEDHVIVRRILEDASLSPAVSSLLDVLLYLEQRRGLTLAEELHREGKSLSTSDVLLLTKWCSTWKVKSALEELIIQSAALKLDFKSKIAAYEVLVVLYGKESNWTCLENILQRLALEPGGMDMSTVALKARHFYRCANITAPHVLSKLLDYN